MTIKTRPMRPGDVGQLRLQQAQRWMQAELTAGYGGVLGEIGSGFTVELDNRPIATIGVVNLAADRCLAWALMTDAAGRHLLTITRQVRRWLECGVFQRVEAAVECDFDAGHRWARVLGFECEAPRMRAFANGRDHALYARIWSPAAIENNAEQGGSIL